MKHFSVVEKDLLNADGYEIKSHSGREFAIRMKNHCQQLIEFHDASNFVVRSSYQGLRYDHESFNEIEDVIIFLNKEDRFKSNGTEDDFEDGGDCFFRSKK